MAGLAGSFLLHHVLYSLVLPLPTLPDQTHGTQCTDTDKRWFAPTGEGGVGL